MSMMLKIVRAGAQPARLKNSIPYLFRGVTPIANNGIKTAAAIRSFATIGSEGSDSDFAPKKAAPVATQGRDAASEIKQVHQSEFILYFPVKSADTRCRWSHQEKP